MSCILVSSFVFRCFALFQQYGLRSPLGPSPSSSTFYELEETVKGSFYKYLPGFTSGTISPQASLVGFLIISSVFFLFLGLVCLDFSFRLESVLVICSPWHLYSSCRLSYLLAYSLIILISVRSVVPSFHSPYSQ